MARHKVEPIQVSDALVAIRTKLIVDELQVDIFSFRVTWIEHTICSAEDPGWRFAKTALGLIIEVELVHD